MSEYKPTNEQVMLAGFSAVRDVIRAVRERRRIDKPFLEHLQSVMECLRGNIPEEMLEAEGMMMPLYEAAQYHNKRR